MDIVLLLFLILLNGVLAMSEIAVVSSRQSRLQKLADDGNRGARSALALSHEPSIFLSTVQVGITTVGILNGAIGETALAVPLAERLAAWPLLAPHAEGISLTVVGRWGAPGGPIPREASANWYPNASVCCHRSASLP